MFSVLIFLLCATVLCSFFYLIYFLCDSSNWKCIWISYNDCTEQVNGAVSMSILLIILWGNPVLETRKSDHEIYNPVLWYSLAIHCIVLFRYKEVMTKTFLTAGCVSGLQPPPTR